jgi:predicted O-methyltransferase YrrM
MHSQADRVDPPLLERAAAMAGAERAAALSEAFIPVDREAGRLLYSLVRNARPGVTVEFGTSFGISTIYMAAAARDRGSSGKVVTTELNENKAERAAEFIAEAKLSEFVELRRGDARQTLTGLAREVTVAFLDGMKELYLPVLRLLEPALQPGALVIGDDIELFPEALEQYVSYVREPSNGYVSVTVPIGDGMELSSRS